MPIIALLTDRPKSDFYTSVVKAKLLSLVNNATIIEIAEEVKPHQIDLASFILKNVYMAFPEDTIFISSIKSEPSEGSPIVVVQKNKRWFIGVDNGLFSLALDFPDKMVALDTSAFPLKSSFFELDVFPELALKILNSGMPEEIGSLVNSFNRKSSYLPTIDNSQITGKVVYIDAYKNIITNIDRDLFERIGKGRDFEITIQSNRNKINKINEQYNESESGDLLAIFNHLNLLEIATFEGLAADLFNLTLNSVVRISFYDKKNSELKLSGFESGSN